MDTSEKFLQQNANVWSGTLHLNDDIKIQELLKEQEKLQQLYNEVVAYIQQHPQMPTEEMIKYQTQLKQLSEYYQKNQEKLKTLGYSRVQVNKNVVIKNWAKRNLSLKTIFLGCAGLIGLFVLGLSILSFYLANNPEKLWGFWTLGIQPAVAKSILQGLSLTIMLVILGLGVVILILNAYKSFTLKNKPKGRYYAGMILWLVVLSIGLWAGASLLDKVSKIDVVSLANPNDIVAMYMNVNDSKGNAENFLIDESFPLIAPVNVPVSLTTTNFDRFINDQLGGSDIWNLQLDCGNGQILSYNEKTRFFEGACFYTRKNDYPIALIVGHTIRSTNKKETTTFQIKTLKIWSELKIQWIDKQLSWGQNELVVWPLPSQVEFKADQVFRDFNLKNYTIEWDGDNDGIVDKKDDSTFVFNYDVSKVYYPKVSFPGFTDKYYTFPLRVEQSGIPVCKIALEQQKVNDYLISASFFDGAERFVGDYSFVFYDKATGKIIDEIHDTDIGMRFNYRFPGKWNYLIKMNFITTDDKKWSCQTEAQLVDKASFNVLYELSASSPNDMTYRKLDTNKIIQQKEIHLSEIPTKLKLKLLKIEPKTFNTKVNVYLDEKPIIFTTEGEYLFDIQDTKEHKVKIQIQDKVRGLDYEEVLTTRIGLDDIIWKLQVLWESIGFEPFEVSLDASSSRLNDTNDQITYFSWDFWDGQQQQKVSNGVIKHKYRFDYKNNNGTFTPQVTIYTQKGRSITVTSNTSVVVKKQLIKLDISSPSHPTQEARIWDSVSFSLDFNGLPKKISWDFWDGQAPLECEGRTCTEMIKSWSEKGSYLIKVKMDFEDQQSVEQTMQFKIRG